MAILCAMVSYALMNLVMTSTPLAVVGCGFETLDAADVVSAHVLAMYIPSFFTGHLIAKFGVEKVVGLGLLLLMGSGGAALVGVELHYFFLSTILRGLGCNFGFSGATAMLASAHAPEERGRIQGFNDFAVFCGHDSLALNVVKRGGAGAITAGTNVSGKLLCYILKNFKNEKNIKNFNDLQNLQSEIRTTLTSVEPISLMKAYFSIVDNIPDWNNIMPPLKQIENPNNDKLVLLLKEQINKIEPLIMNT